MNIELPELSKRLLAVGGAALIGLAALAACSPESDGGTDTTNAAEDAGADDGAAEEETTSGDGTSPDAPLAAGSTIAVGDWTIGVSDVNLDATDAIMAENEFNEAPEAGFQQAMYTVEGTYDGTETGTLWLDVTVGIWADGTFYSGCANVVPGVLLDTPDVSGGGEASGATCAEIPEGTTDALIYVEDLFSLDGTQYFIEIA
jgi:hypothetical protein